MSDYQAMQAELTGAIAAATDLDALEALRVAALGKAGSVTGLLKTLGGLSPEGRQTVGPQIHALREGVTAALADPSLQGQLIAMGMESAPLDPVAYGKRIKQEVAAFEPLAKELASE